MRIECDKCGAAYAIDDKLISDKGVRAQCPKCGEQKVVKKQAAAPAPGGNPFGAPSGPRPVTGMTDRGAVAAQGGGNPFGPPGGTPPAAPSSNPFGPPTGPGGAPAAPPQGSPFGAPPPTSQPASQPAGSPFAAPSAAPSAGGNPFAAPGGGAPGAPSPGGNPFAAPGGGADPFAKKDPFAAPAPGAPPGGAPAGADPFAQQPGASPFGAPAGGAPAGNPFGGPLSPSSPPAPSGMPASNVPPAAADPLSGAGAFGDPAPAADAGNPFEKLNASGDDMEDPFAGIDTDDAGGQSADGDSGGWQVKVGRGRLREDITLPDLREMIRAGDVGGDDLAAPMGKELKKVRDDTLLAVSLPKGTTSRAAVSGARAVGGSSRMVVVAILLVSLVGGGVYGSTKFFPELWESAGSAGVNPFRRILPQWNLQFPDVEGTSQEHVIEGHKYMRADTASGYRQADEQLRMALLLDVGNLNAIAGYVENYANLPNARADAERMRLTFDGIEWARRRDPKNTDLLRAHAALLLASGEVDAAQKLLVQANRISGSDLMTQLLLARTHLDQNASEAISLVESVRRSDPDLQQALLVLGAAERRIGSFKKARSLLEKRLSTDPGNVGALKELARLELDLGEGKAAIKWLNKLLASEERDVEARLMQAKISYQILGNRKAAEKQLKFIVDNYKKAAGDLILPTLTHYAHLRVEAKDYKGAQKLLNEALAIDPQFAPAYYIRGRLQSAEGHQKEAQRSLDDAVGLVVAGRDNLWEPVVRSSLADVMIRQGKIAEGQRNFTQVIDYAPRYARGYFGLASSHMMQNKPGMAATVMRKALDIDPNHEVDQKTLTDYPTSAHDLLQYADVFARTSVDRPSLSLKLSGEGMIRFLAGDRSGAKRLFARALKEDHFNHGALLYRAVMELDEGHSRKATTDLKTALKSTAGSHSITQLYLARAELMAGNFASAKKRLQSTIENEPTLAQATYFLGLLYLKQGQVGEAMKKFKTVVREAPDFLPVKRSMATIGGK